jgi:hypothetical protein
MQKMRKFYRSVIVVVFAGIPALTTAQSSSPTLAFGVTGGINISSLSFSQAGNVDSKSGFFVGGFLRETLNDMWAFQGELHYTMKGAKGAAEQVSLNYVELPLLLRAYLSSAATRPFVEFGPALSLRAGCSFTAAGSSSSTSCTAADSVKSFDAGIAGGGGIEIPFGSSSVEIGVRYTFGVMDISYGYGTKNRNLQFVAGFRF